MNRNRKLLFLGAPLAIILLAIVGGLIFRGEYPTEQTAHRSFVIDEDFTKVRKIMVRTKAAQEIVTMGGDSEFVEQSWQDGNVGLGEENLGEALTGEKPVRKALLKNVFSSDPDWKLQMQGTLKIRTLDDYIGQEVVELKQNVEIVPDSIKSQVDLVEGSERLLGYAMTTRLAREEAHTRVELQLTQQIKTAAPWFAHGIADRRVRKSAEQALANQEQAMRQLIEENADKAGLLPLR